MWPSETVDTMQLLHIASKNAADNAPGHHQHHQDLAAVGSQAVALNSSSTFTLRVAAIFVILAAGLLGVIPPLVGNWLSGSPNGATARIIRAWSGGTILALALVHIIPESFEQLEGAAGQLPVGSIMVIAGLMAMIVLEYTCTYLSLRRVHRKSDSRPAAGTRQPNLLPTAQHPHNPAAACCAAVAAAAASTKTPDGRCIEAQDSLKGADADVVSMHGGAATVLSSSHNLESWQQPPKLDPSAVRQQVGCVTMELGCVFHSVILGLALGVMTDAPHLVLTLLVVLAVHQAVEGLALGSVLTTTPGMSRAKKYVFAVLYALTLPAGIAAGMLASSSYDAESRAAVITQGIANGVSGGMLLYVSLCNLCLAELATQQDLLQRPLLAVCVLLSMVFGAVVMCVLGIWA